MLYIYIYIIMKTMCPSGFHHNGFVVTPALGHMMHMRCYKSIVVTTEKHTVFITYILCPSCFFEIWALCVSWITYDHLYIQYYINMYYINISLYCREGFSHPFNFLVVSKGTQWSNFHLITIYYNVNKRILFQLINKYIAFNLIVI